jgi:hypothetical protein
MPFVASDEDDLVFGYREAQPVSREGCTIVKAQDFYIFKFGHPNDEVMNGHRYASLGLGPYSAYEVFDSEWVHELMVSNRVHEMHDDGLFKSLRHFIFTFHDSTLEFIVGGELLVSRMKGKVSEQVVLALSEK